MARFFSRFDREKHDVPVAAVELAEDVVALQLALELLGRVNVGNITYAKTAEQRAHGHDMMRSTLLLVELWHRYAKKKLATEYLAK